MNSSSDKECGQWSRLLNKRELLAHYVLCREDGLEWNIGEIIDKLMNELYVSRKVAFTITRRLRRMNLLKRIDNYVYKCIGFEKYIEELYRNYICRKKSRLMKQ